MNEILHLYPQMGGVNYPRTSDEYFPYRNKYVSKVLGANAGSQVDTKAYKRMDRHEFAQICIRISGVKLHQIQSNFEMANRNIVSFSYEYLETRVTAEICTGCTVHVLPNCENLDWNICPFRKYYGELAVSWTQKLIQVLM